MSLARTYTASCDSGINLEWGPQTKKSADCHYGIGTEDDPRAVNQLAAKRGWYRVPGRGHRRWDYCPPCTELNHAALVVFAEQKGVLGPKGT